MRRYEPSFCFSQALPLLSMPLIWTKIRYLKHFAFPPEMALIRLDGAYGDATVVAQLLLAGTPSVPRWRGYLLLEHPQRKPRAGSCTDSEHDEDEQRCGSLVV